MMPSVGHDERSARLTPVQPGERLLFVDALRGLALLGILVENMAVYAGYSYRLEPLSSGSAGQALPRVVLGIAVQFLLEAKSYSMLALLFGWGVACLSRSSSAQRELPNHRLSSFVPLYLRRLLVLFGFGLMHGVLIWYGDILMLYALLGTILILFRRRSARSVLIAAACAFLLSIVLTLPGEAMDAFRAWYEGVTAFLRYNVHPESLYRTGTYAQVTARRVQDLLGANSWLIYYAGNVLGMFLLGLYIGKRGLFRSVGRRLPNLRKVMWISLAIGVPLNALFVATSLWPQRVPADYHRFVRVGSRTVGAPALVLFYVTLVILLVQGESWRRRLAQVTPVGRMSLSNYLFQSIVCTLIFYGYGLGLYGQVGPVSGLVLAVILYLVQIRISAWWFERYWFGPLEWIWRSLIYGWQQLLAHGEHPQAGGTHGDWDPNQAGKMSAIRAAIAAGVVVVVLAVLGIVVWQLFSAGVVPGRPEIKTTAVVTSAATGTRDRPQVGASSRESEPDTSGADACPISTPVVHPAHYAPGPIAATGDLAALAFTFDPDSALGQIETLTGPPYLGRYPSSPGGQAAGEYLAEQFAAYGLQPAGDSGTFFQSFPVEYVALADVPRLAVERFDGKVIESYAPHQDFGAILRGYSGAGAVEGEAVWASNCAREDFDLLDVVDKVVLCRDTLIPEAQRNALEHGAAGLLLVTDPGQRPPDFGSTYRETWVSEPIPAFRVFPSVTQDLLLGSGHSVADLSSTFTPFPLLSRVRMQVNTVGAESCPRAGCLARNVLGVLPGRDPQHASQVVILGAHYDHLGQSPDGTVWAGANDNASGVAVMLEIAKRWHEQGYVPRRTVLFAAWDAEEMGLLGSRYYVEHPRYPLGDTVAKIQLDMVGAGGDVLRVDGGGELGEDLLSIARHLGIEAERTEMGRSDHVPFQIAGVPASLLIWSFGDGKTESEDAVPHYHRPVDVPATIDTRKLDAVGKVAGISLLSLADGELAIQDLLERRIEAVREGDLDAFLSTSTPEQQAGDRLWFSDLYTLRGQTEGAQQAAGQALFNMQVRDVRVLGRTASARVRIESELAAPEGGLSAGQQRSQNMSAETAVRFVHSGSGWQWAGPDLTFEDQTKVGPGDGVRFAVAYPPGYEGTLNGLDQLAERQYEQIATLLGLPMAPEAALLLFPDATSLRAHTSLLLPPGQDEWVGFRVVKTVFNQELATPQLDGALTQLALAEVGANEAVAPWLWNGLPLALRAQTGMETSAYLAELQAGLISGVPEGQDAQDDVLSWAAIEYLRQQVGWRGLGRLAISLGRACTGEGVQADQGSCSNPDALDVALSDVVHMDADTFEAAWRAYWGERLDMMQAGIDAVLSARVEAVLTGDQDALINTLDSDIPNLVVEERQWFADLAENPVEQFSLTGKPVVLLEDGSLLTTVTMRYRLAEMEGRWDEGTVLRDILFTPADDGYRWAGARLGVVRGERVSVFYPRPNLGPERVGEGYRDLAHALAEEAERMLPAFADKLGVDPPSEVTIRLYKNDHVFRTSIALPFPAVEWVPAWANGEASVKIRLDDQATSQEYQAILARYLAWHLLCRMGVDSEWLLKGASTYLAGAVDGGANARQATQSLNKVLDAALEGDLYALAALPPDYQLVNSSEFRIAKSLSYDTTNYLTETYGYQTLLQLLQSQAHGQDVDTVLRSLVGSTLSEFEAEWSESLARGHALPEWIEIARSFDPDVANQHVEYLASRQLAGRQAGSPGAELASAYIAARFVEYGLVPASGVTQTGQEPAPTRFFQRFPITYTTWISSPDLQVHGLDGQVDESLVHRQDFVAIVDQVSGEGSVAGDLLWVRSTDWQGIDLNGKIVICDVSESPQVQVSRAIEHGASGLILIGNKASQRSVLAKSPLPTTNSLSQTIPTLELTRQGAARLLEAAGQTQGSLAASPPALHLGLKATVDVPLSTPATVETANVLGLLPGSNPRLSREIVIVGAHYDHVGDDPGGTGPGTAGRRYAGANDNASGIGVLLEIARLWQETGYRPQRSVLFVAWGAQEPGEIGSTYYVTHPAFPLESTVAVFQLDGVGGGRGYFLEAQGDPAQEGLLRFILEAAETQVDGRLTLTRPSDRSDDRPFRQAGIPTLLLTWRESSEGNLPTEQADPVESYRLGVTGRMASLALMTIAR